MPGYQMCRARAAQQWMAWVNGTAAIEPESCSAYADYTVLFRAAGDGAAYTAEIPLCTPHEVRAFTSPLHASSIKRRPPT